MTEKPHKGAIADWKRWFHPQIETLPKKGLGYIIVGGNYDDGLRNAGGFIRTSIVVAHNSETGDVETLNSRYTLIGESDGDSHGWSHP